MAWCTALFLWVCVENDSHTFTCVNVRMQPDWQPKQSTEKLRVQHRLNVFVWCLSVSGHHYYIFIQKIGVCCYFKAQNKVFTLSVAPTRQSTWGSSQKSCSLCVYGCVRHFCEWNLPTYSCFLSVLGFWWVHEPGTRWCWGGPHEDQEQKAAG